MDAMPDRSPLFTRPLGLLMLAGGLVVAAVAYHHAQLSKTPAVSAKIPVAMNRQAAPVPASLTKRSSSSSTLELLSEDAENATLPASNKAVTPIEELLLEAPESLPGNNLAPSILAEPEAASSPEQAQPAEHTIAPLTESPSETPRP
jgi:hypothetical protein